MTDNNNNINSSNNNRPTNLVEFESQETKHKFRLDKYPDISTEALLISLKDIVKSIDAPSNSRQTDCQFLSLQYWAEMCVELLGMRIRALYNRIDNCGK
ncbi:MAG: hypothetical protein WBW34_03165 [Nitrososphaeraceae archaeon]